MLEISPVLSGKFSDPAYAPPGVNFTTGNLSRDPLSSEESVNETDTRRHTRFDRTACDAGSTTDFSFSDFLDLINPIEHIPGLSSVLRSLHGDTIHPVSRVAGDILFGGILGLGSAVFGAIGAVADSVSEASNGQDGTGLVVTALLGDPSASAHNAPQTRVASSQPAPIIDPAASGSAQALAAMLQTEENAARKNVYDLPSLVSSATQPLTLAQAQQAKSYPLDRAHLPYGGVMAPVRASPQEQSLALYNHPRVDSALHATRPQRDSEVSAAQMAPQNGRLGSSHGTSPSQAPSARNALPQALVDDLLALRALHAYPSVAAGPSLGTPQ